MIEEMPKEIKYNGKWYKEGDKIIIKRKVPFLLFWNKEKYIEHTVSYIGNDCGAICIANNENIWGRQHVIIGSIRII